MEMARTLLRVLDIFYFYSSLVLNIIATVILKTQSFNTYLL